MPLAEQFHQALAAAKNGPAVDNVCRLLWSAHSGGHVDDLDAQAIAEAASARRRAWAANALPKVSTAASGRRAAPRSPDRQASLERRRRQAMSGALPPAIAARFSMGEIAALAVVARQCQREGTCSLPIDAIAALAGVGRTSVQNALRAARRFGLIDIKERRRRGLRSLTNIVRVISREWTSWLRLRAGGQAADGVGQRGGFRLSSPTNTDSRNRGQRAVCSPPATRAEFWDGSPGTNDLKPLVFLAESPKNKPEPPMLK